MQISRKAGGNLKKIYIYKEHVKDKHEMVKSLLKQGKQQHTQSSLSTVYSEEKKKKNRNRALPYLQACIWQHGVGSAIMVGHLEPLCVQLCVNRHLFPFTQSLHVSEFSNVLIGLAETDIRHSVLVVMIKFILFYLP